MYAVRDMRAIRWAALIVGLVLSVPWGEEPVLRAARLVAAAGLLTYALMPWVIRLAHKFGAMDYPDASRRVHQQPTPRIGGVAVLVSTNLTLLLNFDFSLGLKGVCLSALMVAMLSLWDDVRELPAAFKLLGQLLAISVLIYFGVHVDFAPDAWWGDWLEYLLTALWVVGITNAYNFMDGINGLAASLAATVCLLMGLLAWYTGQYYMLLICLPMFGAAVGFLPDNGRYRGPARVFLGDVGSTYIGWMMASVAVLGDWSDEGAIKAYSAPLLIFSVMIFDMIYTTVARIYRGDVNSFREWIAYVGRDHLHHRLMNLGLTQFQTVLVIVAISAIMGTAALTIVESSMFGVALLLFQAIFTYAMLSFLMIHSRKLE